MNKWCMGIDPGSSGAIAFYNGKDIHISSFPTIKYQKSNGKSRNDIDIEETAELIYQFHDLNTNEIVVALIEEVGAMPGQGVTSMFSFGKSYGIILGILGAFRIPTLKTKPGVWKANMNLSHDKQKSVDLANKTFKLTLKKSQDGQAEAALLAKLAHDMNTKEN